MSAGEIILTVCLGVLASFIASLVFWFIFFRAMRPNMSWCSNIARFTNDDGRVRSQIKLRNGGRRDATNVVTYVRLVLPGLIRSKSIENITIQHWVLPVLAPGREVRYTVRPELMPSEEKKKYQRYFPDNIRTALQTSSDIDLREVLQIHPNARLKVHTFALDGFSGATAHASVGFRVDDVSDGRFRRHSCEVAHPGSAGSAPSDDGGVVEGPQASVADE